MNKMRTLLLTLIGFSLLVLGASARPAMPHVFYHENVLGTSLAIKVLTTSPTAAERAEAAALAEIERQARILSTYDPQSEVSRWLRTTGTPQPVSPELYAVLDLFDHWRGRTDGAIDPAVEVISRLWREAAKASRRPTAGEIATALVAVRQPHWRLDSVNRTATRLSEAPLVLNSFVKSFIIDRATTAAMAAAGAEAVVLNIGGDLVARGGLTEPVVIADPLADAENSPPLARLLIRDRAVATSGNYRRGVRIGPDWYSHIVDPRNGRPVEQIISSTVVAANPSDAGALATAFSILAPEESLRLAATMPGVECLLVARNGARITSPGWKALEVAIPEPDAPVAPATRGGMVAAGQAWDASMELVVSFELANLTGFSYRRPYVAVWIEDKDRFPVRTLALWYQKPRWLPDLKGWMRGDRLRSLAEGTDLTASVSSATRPAGKYSLKWDGRDNQGRPVKPGRYTIYIEAAREHGTYQLMRQEMDLHQAPQQASLPGNAEISAATISYQKRASR